MPAGLAGASCPRCKKTVVHPHAPAAMPTSRSSAMTEEEALAEAIRRSLGQASDLTHSNSNATVHGRHEQMDEARREQTVKSFCEITGCESDLAVYCLNEHKWNLDNALNEYLEYKKLKGSSGAKQSKGDLAVLHEASRDDSRNGKQLLMQIDDKPKAIASTSVDMLDLFDNKTAPSLSVPAMPEAPEATPRLDKSNTAKAAQGGEVRDSGLNVDVDETSRENGEAWITFSHR
mmetsp:Transcript_3704/g.13233  ORF Transcript_3704/g.13233 Transcript_3704/m.13233 type:complete len:233 (+) Transcript_3704:902-1600(+)